MGLVAACFVVLNISIRPIETINGPIGLYVWNFTAGKLWRMGGAGVRLNGAEYVCV